MFPSLQLLITDLIIIFHAAQWVHILINGGVCRMWLALLSSLGAPRWRQRCVPAGALWQAGLWHWGDGDLNHSPLSVYLLQAGQEQSWRVRWPLEMDSALWHTHTHTHSHSKYTHFRHTHLHVGPAVFHSLSMPYALTTPGLMDP